ncbi:MAG: hypothetical protein V4805_03595 [Pseudomonadota bacterium]
MKQGITRQSPSLRAIFYTVVLLCYVLSATAIVCLLASDATDSWAIPATLPGGAKLRFKAPPPLLATSSSGGRDLLAGAGTAAILRPGAHATVYVSEPGNA